MITPQLVAAVPEGSFITVHNECLITPDECLITPQLVAAVPDGSPLLSTLGKNFHSVGMSTEAMGAFIKGGDAKAAIDSCVQHHKWESALHLA